MSASQKEPTLVPFGRSKATVQPLSVLAPPLVTVYLPSPVGGLDEGGGLAGGERGGGDDGDPGHEGQRRGEDQGPVVPHADLPGRHPSMDG
jgi:hypothetical protein